MTHAHMQISPQLKEVLKLIVEVDDEPHFMTLIDSLSFSQEPTHLKLSNDLCYLILGHHQLYIIPSDLLHNAASHTGNPAQKRK